MTMRQFLTSICVLTALVIAGCGSNDNNDAPIGAVDATKPAPTGEASAGQVAKEMRGNVKCPAKESNPRPAGAAVDDVVGVRPGMGWNEAATFVMCDNPMIVVTENTGRNYDIQTYGQKLRQGFDGKWAEARVAKTSRDYLREMSDAAARRSGNAAAEPLPGGQSRFYVSTMGLPGQEQVISVAREEAYADGKQPTIESLTKALIAKYGQPSRANDTGQLVQMWWAYDPSGTKFESAQCQFAVSPDAGTSLSTACGLTVGAQIQASNTNPGLARSLAVSSQSSAWGYELLMKTEGVLKAADASKKAKEIEDASKNASAPKL
jgi:hypothetical protein